MALFDKAALVANLRQLDAKGQIAFAAACCERLLPNYRAFVIMEAWGNHAVLRKALDTVWAAVEGRKAPAAEIEELTAALAQAIPDSEDFGSIFTGSAQYAGAAVIHVLQSMLKPDVAELAQTGALAIDTVYEYLDAVCDPYSGSHGGDPHLDEWIEEAPMLRAELARQQEDIELIRSWKGQTAELVRRLQDSSNAAGIQPLRRGLVKKPGP